MFKHTAATTSVCSDGTNAQFGMISSICGGEFRAGTAGLLQVKSEGLGQSSGGS